MRNDGFIMAFTMSIFILMAAIILCIADLKRLNYVPCEKYSIHAYPLWPMGEDSTMQKFSDRLLTEKYNSNNFPIIEER
jgi:hypothetical protein